MDVLREPVGKQDPYVAAHGGICGYTFHRDGGVDVEPLELDPGVLRRLRDQLLLFFTGEARAAATVLTDQDTRSKAGDEQMIENLHRTKELGLRSRELLMAGELEAYAELMHEHWEHKRRRSPGMTDEHIDRLYTLARRSGVLGGKLVGAGGGGFLLVYAPARRTPGRRWPRRAPQSSRSTSSSAGLRQRVPVSGLRVAIVGCGLIGAKRAAALARDDELLACYDVNERAARGLSELHGATACATLEELLATRPDVVIVATVHDQLAALTERALQAGAHVLVEKPAGVSAAQIDRLIECQRASGRLVKVGFNHRFHPGVARAAEEVHGEHHGELMHLRARYGHGGRVGYDREWRAEPARSGGGELVDQGMHLLDLSHWLAGPLELHSALLRTHFWDTPVEDNAALILARRSRAPSPGRCCT